jgi:hypothetical protein
MDKEQRVEVKRGRTYVLISDQSSRIVRGTDPSPEVILLPGGCVDTDPFDAIGSCQLCKNPITARLYPLFPDGMTYDGRAPAPQFGPNWQFTFTGVGPGNYALVVTEDTNTETQKVHVQTTPCPSSPKIVLRPVG